MKTKLGVATVIGLGMTSTALSADLPQVAVEPIGYVATCDAFGAGYFQIPGKDTCLKLGGRVRVQAVSGNMANNNGLKDYHGDKLSEYSMYSRSHLYLTSMTATEFGTIKTFFEGLYEWSGDEGEAEFLAGDAYVQLGLGNASLLVGNTESLFDGFIGYAALGTVSRNWSEYYMTQAQLIYGFDNGLSVGVSAENGYARGGPANSIDFVGMAKIDQGWGSFRVSGGLHNKDSGGYGFGVNATTAFNIPTTGTELTFQATYADSAVTYLGGAGSFVGLGEHTSNNLIKVNKITDTYLSNQGFNGWSLAAGIQQPITETITFAIDGTYAQLSGALDDTAFIIPLGAVNTDIDRLAIDASLSWEPVEGLILAAGAGWNTTNYSWSGEKVVDDSTSLEDIRIGTRVQYTF